MKCLFRLQKYIYVKNCSLVSQKGQILFSYYSVLSFIFFRILWRCWQDSMKQLSLKCQQILLLTKQKFILGCSIGSEEGLSKYLLKRNYQSILSFSSTTIILLIIFFVSAETYGYLGKLISFLTRYFNSIRFMQPENGFLPYSISQKITPSDQISVFSVYFLRSKI